MNMLIKKLLFSIKENNDLSSKLSKTSRFRLTLTQVFLLQVTWSLFKSGFNDLQFHWKKTYNNSLTQICDLSDNINIQHTRNHSVLQCVQ